MKNIFVLFLFLVHHSYCQQQLSGMVINGVDGVKLASASVFINNSSKGITTDSEGKFVIAGLTEKHFELIISYSGFKTATINITSENINEFHTVKLYPRNQELKEISIMMPEKDGWKHWGKLFTDLFIGKSDFAKMCTIENPEVLRFSNNRKTSLLHAYSNSALIIHNKALGYKIKYQLEEFIYDFKNKIITYLGYTGFENIGVKNENKKLRWDKNRREVYEGSLLHFMRAVYRDSVSVEGFDIKSKIRIYPDDTIYTQIYKPNILPYFIRIENKIYKVIPGPVPPLKKVPAYIDLIDTTNFSFKTATTFNPEKKERSFYFENYLDITYKNAFEKVDFLRYNFLPLHLKVHQYSDITLISDIPLMIEENGLFFNPINLLSSGYMGWRQMAETLPSDYIYIK